MEHPKGEKITHDAAVINLAYTIATVPDNG